MRNGGRGGRTTSNLVCPIVPRKGRSGVEASRQSVTTRPNRPRTQVLQLGSSRGGVREVAAPEAVEGSPVGSNESVDEESTHSIDGSQHDTHSLPRPQSSIRELHRSAVNKKGDVEVVSRWWSNGVSRWSLARTGQTKNPTTLEPARARPTQFARQGQGRGRAGTAQGPDAERPWPDTPGWPCAGRLHVRHH